MNLTRAPGIVACIPPAAIADEVATVLGAAGGIPVPTVLIG